MKKIFTLLTVAFALPFLFACNKDKGGATIATGAMFSSAQTFTIESANMFASFNADGSFIAGKPNNGGEDAFGFTKDKITTYDIIKGTYTYDPATSTYTMYIDGSTWGTLQVKAGYTIHLKIQSAGLDQDFTGVTLSEPNRDDEIQRASNHTWKAVETIVNYKGINYSNAGVDLNNFAAWVIKNFGGEDPFKPNMVLENAVITDSYVAFFFKNGQQIVGKVSLKSGNSFTFTPLAIEGKDKVTMFEGEASINISADKLVFSVKGQYNKENAEMIITLGL